MGRFGSPPAAFQEIPWKTAPNPGPDRRKTGNNRNQNRHFSAVAPLVPQRSLSRGEKATSRRHDRVWVHGPGALERIQAGRAVLPVESRSRAQGRVCAQRGARSRSSPTQWGYESTETDWKKLVARPDIDVVDICVPNNLHKEIALAAAANKKAILCEKPLAMNAVEGREMVAAVEKAGVPNMVWYNYRRIPAVTLAKKLIDEGRLGKVFHYRAKFLQDWTIKADLPQGGQGLWRLDVAAAGSRRQRATCSPTASTPRSG